NLPRPEKVIPYRPPHLWLDGVTELTDNTATGFWTPDGEHSLGHFKDMPLLPGVSQIESLVQLGAYVLMLGDGEPALGLLQGIEETKFERLVQLGERLDLFIKIADRTRRNFRCLGIAEVSGALVCRTTIIGTVWPERVVQRLLVQA